MRGTWMSGTGKMWESDLVNIESFLFSWWEEEIGVKLLQTPHRSPRRGEQPLVFNFGSVKWSWRNVTHGEQLPVMQTWLTAVTGSALPCWPRAEMLYCALRILLIWNISQSGSNLLQPVVTNCCFLRKFELVQFTSNRKCLQGWDSADFHAPRKPLFASPRVLKDVY